jgi:hypothetical protein
MNLFLPSIGMIAFQNNLEFNSDKIDLEDGTVSTLLIPSHLIDDFILKKEKYKGNVSFYLRSLLRRFRSITHTGTLPEPKKFKTEYQEKKLHLLKVNFRPRNSDWLELGELALAFGKSRCWVFVHLLKLDILGLWKVLVETRMNKVVPTSPRLELKIFWKLRRVLKHFARGYIIRI